MEIFHIVISAREIETCKMFWPMILSVLTSVFHEVSGIIFPFLYLHAFCNINPFIV